MSESNKEARLHLVLQAYRENPKKGIRLLVTHYRVSESTLYKRVNSITPRSELRQAIYNSLKLKRRLYYRQFLI